MERARQIESRATNRTRSTREMIPGTLRTPGTTPRDRNVAHLRRERRYIPLARCVRQVQRGSQGVGSFTSEFTHLEPLETVSPVNFKIATSPDPSPTSSTVASSLTVRRRDARRRRELLTRRRRADDHCPPRGGNAFLANDPFLLDDSSRSCSRKLYTCLPACLPARLPAYLMLNARAALRTRSRDAGDRDRGLDRARRRTMRNTVLVVITPVAN